ncbi:MAG TPA: hypothetical protein VK821_09395 [Dehalococcoidia bacterium]|nr:hypothetical protein [Dehalococcoidia bacterium]
MLASDNFSDPTSGLFPPISPQPDKWQVGYVNGEYQVAGIDMTADNAAITTDAVFGDARVAADARVDGDTGNTELGIVCRWAGPGGYELDVYPGGGTIVVSKLRGGQRTNLIFRDQDPNVLSGSQTNHLELTCAGRTITARVNGVTIDSVQDTTFTRGSTGLSIARALNPGTVSVRFSNFLVTQP